MNWDCVITTADDLPDRSWGWEFYNFDEPDYIVEDEEEVSDED